MVQGEREGGPGSSGTADARREACLAGGMLPLEGTLLEKLRKIEALHAGTKIDGEREAARRAAERIRARLEELQDGALADAPEREDRQAGADEQHE